MWFLLWMWIFNLITFRIILIADYTNHRVKYRMSTFLVYLLTLSGCFELYSSDYYSALEVENLGRCVKFSREFLDFLSAEQRT